MGNIISGGGAIKKPSTIVKKTIDKTKAYTKPKNKVKSSLYKHLEQMGFKRSILKAHQNLIEEPIFEENYRPSDAIKELWKKWTNMTHLQHAKSVFEVLQLVGFVTKKAKELEPILDPIWPHYTRENIVDIALD